MLQGTSQYQEPTTGFDVLSSSARSTAARSVTGRLKYRTTGTPTPYVWPEPSTILASKVWVGVNVRNEAFRVTDRPEGSTAVAITV